MGLWIGVHQLAIQRKWRIPSAFEIVVFLLVTFFGWAFFSSESLADGASRLMQLLGSGKSIIQMNDFYYLRSGGLILLISLYSATDSFQKLMKRIENVPVLRKICRVLTIPVQLTLLVLCAAVLATQTDISALQWKGVLL